MAAPAVSPLAAYADRLSDAQLRKAIDLVATQRITACRDGYAVDGDRYHVSAYRQTCTCPAGAHGRRCYHLAAAIALDEGAARH